MKYMANLKLPFLIFFYVKYFIIGIIFGELAQLIFTTYVAVYYYFSDYEVLFFLYRISSICVAYLLFLYIYFEEVFEPIFKLFRHDRYDIIVSGLMGLYFSFSAGLIGRSLYKELVPEYISIEAIAFIFSGIIGVVVISAIMSIKRSCHSYPKRREGLILPDEPIETLEQDLLGISGQAEKFADKIYDNGSSQSIVYGLDAPWGLGKTSFINLMQSYWKKKIDKCEINTKQPVIFNFEPLKFSQGENLSDRFIEEIIYVISKEFPVPELTSILGGYSRYLKGLSSVTIFGLQFGINNYQSNNNFKLRLDNFLLQEEIKLIVIIEDLDRILLQEAKQILYSMKSAFDLPNISFIVCYDSKNLFDSLDSKVQISAEARCSQENYALANIDEGNSENLLEFLEKFVQIKVPIFIESNKLVQYLRALVNQLQERSDFNYKEDFILKLSAIIEVMLGVNTEQSYNYYYDILGKTDNSYNYDKIIRDPRKIKRLLNHLVFMDFTGIEYVDEADFLHLLLIYINYPYVFRHIYQVEMETSSGYFTDRVSEGENETKGRNKAYNKFKSGLDSGAKFLLDKVFTEKTSEDNGFDEQDNKKIYAKYSPGIENYLVLITKQRSLPKEETHKFQLELVQDVHKGILTIDEFYENNVNLYNDELQAKLFWFNFSEKIAGNRENYTREKADNVISKLLYYIPLHSALEISELNIGLRDELPRRLLKILENIGWDFMVGGGRHNTLENLKLLAHRIFGIEAFKGQGILDSLLNESRGILGLYDLMLFRLYASPDRSGNYFNINRALLTYKGTSKEIEVSGSEYVINCMRDLSQVVFAKFQEFFIDKKLNLFSEIDALTLDQLSGGRTGFIQSSLSNNKINAEIEITKTKLKTFISFQLGNMKIDSGIGCGYYDLKGNEDKKGINAAYNAYLFNVVFNPEKSENAYPYFLDYLLINSGSTFEYHSKRRLLKCEKYKDVLDIGRLKGYIEKHQKNLIAEIDRLIDQKRQITFEKEVMTYQDYKHDITTFLETKGVE